MINDNRHHDDSAFRPKDAIDDLFGGASPNPQRIGCPGKDVLRAAARKALEMDHAVYGHLAECSPCYRELRGYQQQDRQRSWLRAALATAATVALAFSVGPYVGRSLGIGPWATLTQTIVLDYRSESASRSEAGEMARLPKTLPRTKIAAIILAPTGSEPGQYELRLVDGSGRVRLGQTARGDMENYAVRAKVNLDLRSVGRGSYSLEIRRVGEDWDPHPVEIR